MSDQVTIEEAIAARDEAVRTVAASEAPFVAVAFEALVAVVNRERLWAREAGMARPITSEDVWAKMTDQGFSKPAEPRAMGPVMLRGVREGLIRPTGRFVTSTMRTRHAGPIREYEVVR